MNFPTVQLISNPKHSGVQDENSKKYVAVRLHTERSTKTEQQDLDAILSELTHCEFYQQGLAIEQYEKIEVNRKSMEMQDGDQLAVMTEGKLRLLSTRYYGLGRSIYENII